MITVIGATNIDIIAASKTAFVAHDSNPSHITMGIGGVGKNYAHNLALLGEHIQFISLFGDDYLGDVAKKECKRLGFDLHLSDTPKGARSSMFLCINNTASRSGGCRDYRNVPDAGVFGSASGTNQQFAVGAH